MLLTQQLGGPQDGAPVWVLGQPTEVPAPRGCGLTPSETQVHLCTLPGETLDGVRDAAPTVRTWESNIIKLTGDPQGGGPHSEENQLRGEILSPLFCGNIQTDQPAENWARGATSQCSGQADEAGVEMVCRGQVEVRLSRKCV